MILNHTEQTFKTKMCIYTKRLYHCWCVDYYIKFTNRCTASLRSDKECPRPPYLTKCEVEKVGLYPFHSHEEEAKLVAAGIPNPGYTKTNPEAGNSQQAETVAKTRYSDPNPEAKSNKRLVDVEGEVGGENRRSGIRTSKTFPQSPPPAAQYRRSDPVLEGRGVPNPWILSPQKLQRSKTSAQAPPPPPRPGSFQQSPSEEPQSVGVLPNPWKLSPQKLQRSKTSAQAPPPPLPQRPGSFQLPPSQPVSSVPTPPHRSNTTTTTTSPYTPIQASHLQRASTYTPPTSTSSTSRNPTAGAKPVQVAIRDSRGFFIPPAVYQEPKPELETAELDSPPPPQVHRSITYSSRSSIQINPQIGLPLQSQRSSTYSARSSKSRDSVQAENPPILIVRHNSISLSPSKSTAAQRLEKERKKSNRVSFVYQKSDDDADGEENEEIYPKPLHMQMQWRDGEMGAEGRGRDDGEEIREDYGFSGEVEEEVLFAAQLQAMGLDGERKKKRKSIWRQSVGMGMGVSRAGIGDTEEEILYSGSDYEGGEDSETEIMPVVDRNGGNVKREERKARRKSVRNQSMETPHTDPGFNEEEILYSGSDYDGELEDSDSELISSRDGDGDLDTGESKMKGKGNEVEAVRGSVLFEMLYAHASLPQSQFQSQAAAGPSLEERRDRRMSIQPLVVKKGVGGGGVGKEVYTDSEYETEYVDTD